MRGTPPQRIRATRWLLGVVLAAMAAPAYTQVGPPSTVQILSALNAATSQHDALQATVQIVRQYGDGAGVIGEMYESVGTVTIDVASGRDTVLYALDTQVESGGETHDLTQFQLSSSRRAHGITLLEDQRQVSEYAVILGYLPPPAGAEFASTVWADFNPERFEETEFEGEPAWHLTGQPRRRAGSYGELFSFEAYIAQATGLVRLMRINTPSDTFHMELRTDFVEVDPTFDPQLLELETYLPPAPEGEGAAEGEAGEREDEAAPEDDAKPEDETAPETPEDKDSEDATNA